MAIIIIFKDEQRRENLQRPLSAYKEKGFEYINKHRLEFQRASTISEYKTYCSGLVYPIHSLDTYESCFKRHGVKIYRLLIPVLFLTPQSKHIS